MNNGHRYADTATIAAPAAALFDYLDDPRRLGAHMSRPSWRMLGATMAYQLDAAGGRAVDSHIRLSGRLLGLRLFVDEVVTIHDVPARKVWRTVGRTRLLVVGDYEMGFEITPSGAASQLRIFISWSLPHGPAWLLGWLLGGPYARWCVTRMKADAARHFASVTV